MSTPTENNYGGQPPENPYGQQNPYGQPENPYGQAPNPYGQPPNPYGQFYGQQPEPGRSGMAIAGLCTFFVPVVGLVFSIIGMVQTGAGKLRGRGIAVTALILSIIASAFWGYGIYKVGSKTSALDPGCTNGKSAIIDGSKKVEADGAADPATVKADIQSIVTNLNAAIGKSHRSDVKSAMQNVADDYNSLLDGITTGNLDPSISTKLQTDLNQVDKLCTIK